jgi:hypothetical protein
VSSALHSEVERLVEGSPQLLAHEAAANLRYDEARRCIWIGTRQVH